MLRFHGSLDKQNFELVGTNSRLDAIQAAALRVFLPRARRLERRPARGGRPLRRPRPRRGGRVAGRRRRARVPHVRRAHARSRPHCRSARRGRHRLGCVLRDAARTCSRRCATSAGARTRCPRRSAPPPRTSPCRCGPASARTSRSASSETVRAAVGVRLRAMRLPVTRHRLWQVAVDGAVVAVAWVAPGTCGSTGRVPSTTTATSTGSSSPSSWPSSCRSSSASASTTAGGDTSRRGTCGAPCAASRLASVAAFLVFSLFELHSAGVPRGIWIIDLLLCLALVAGSRLAARTIIERPMPGQHRRARQGGDRRRRRRRGAADPAGDAAQPAARLHADRARRRRPAQEEPAAARRPRPGHDRRAVAHPARPPARRGADRDPVRTGRVPAADRGRRAARAGPAQDAAGPVRPHLRRLQPRRPDPAGRGRGRPRPRADRGRPRRDLGLPRRPRPCSSRAPAAPSARSCAVRSSAPSPRG